jgi:hypothetical protein
MLFEGNTRWRQITQKRRPPARFYLQKKFLTRGKDSSLRRGSQDQVCPGTKSWSMCRQKHRHFRGTMQSHYPLQGTSGQEEGGMGRHTPIGAGMTSLRKNLRIGYLLIPVLGLSARTFGDHFGGFFS